MAIKLTSVFIEPADLEAVFSWLATDPALVLSKKWTALPTSSVERINHGVFMEGSRNVFTAVREEAVEDGNSGSDNDDNPEDANGDDAVVSSTITGIDDIGRELSGTFGEVFRESMLLCKQ